MYHQNIYNIITATDENVNVINFDNEEDRRS